MPSDKTHILIHDMAKKWPHLAGIADQLNPVTGIELDYLLGTTASSKTQAPREVVIHHEKEPYAQRTALGWGIVGIVGTSDMDGDNCGVSDHVITKEADPAHSLKTCVMLQTTTTQWPIKNCIVPQLSPSGALRILESDLIKQKLDQAYSWDDLTFFPIMGHSITRDFADQYELPLSFQYETKTKQHTYGPEIITPVIKETRKGCGFQEGLCEIHDWHHQQGLCWMGPRGRLYSQRWDLVCSTSWVVIRRNCL